MVDVYIGLGANTGAPRENLREAVRLLGQACEVVAVSSLWATEPVGFLEQDWFLNAAAHVRSAGTPRELLAFLQEIERGMGRQRIVRNGPRTIDLDILLWGGASIDEPGLRIPHPRMHERLFVMEPLWELAPELVVPGIERTVAELRASLAGSMRIELAVRMPW